MNRRDLLRGALAVLCCDTAEIPAAAIHQQRDCIFVDLKLAPELNRKHGAGRIVTEKLNLILVHPSKNRFVALDRKCTHGGGAVAYNRAHGTVQCTCWGQSEFAFDDGRVLFGPAKRPLRTYPARAAGGRLEIRLS